MLRKCLMVGVLASATISIALSETQIGQHVSTSYAMDTVDHFSGNVSFNATDYQIQLGPNSTFPLIRTIQLRGGSTHYTFGYTTAYKTADLYNIGQEVSDKDELKCISQLDDQKATNRFRTPGGETVVFHRVNLKEGTTDQYLSKSNWLLDCSPDKSEFSKQLISPNGMSYYYHQATGSASMGSMLGGINSSRYPDLIADTNGNEMVVTKGLKDLSLQTQYQTITFLDQKLNVSGYTKPIVEFKSVKNGFQVTYQNETGWLYKTEGSDKARVCNPLNLCGTYEFKNVKIRGANENRLVKKTYQVPHYGQYSVTYSYTGDQSSATTLAKYPDHQREYGFQYIKPSTNRNLTGIHWNQGLPRFERVWDLSKSHKFQEITYQHEASEDTASNGESNQTRNNHLRYRVTPQMTEKTTQRWAKNVHGSYVWVGTVKEQYSNFNDYNKPEKVTFSYPGQNGNSLFPSVTYITKYDTSLSIHRTGLVKESYIEGLYEKTRNTYDDHGNLTSKDVNGIVTHYTYHSSGALSTQTDPNGNVRTYSNYDFGIPKTETGPEGYTVSRTVENGFTTSETTWGDRTVKYDYDPFGKLKEFTPAAESRLPIRYGYEFPSSGGMLLTESSGTKTVYTYLNGFGKPFKVITKGLGSGSGSDYAYKKEFEYHYDGSVKSESATVDESTIITDAHRSIYKQDPTGRRLELDPADGDPIAFEYPSHFMTKMTDSAGVVTIEKYQPFAGFGSELLINRRHPSGNTSPSPELELKIDYRENGQLDTVTSGNKTQYFNYHDSGLLESYSTKETGLVQYRYDDNGNLIWEKHNEDTPIRYQYDDLNRLIKKEFTDESLNVDYSYNDFTRIQTVEKNSFGWKYTLNKDEQILEAHLVHKSNLEVPEVVNSYPVYTLTTGTRRVNSGGPGRSGTTTFEYYDYHQEDQITHSSGSISSRGYLDWKFSYQYDAMGDLTLIRYPDGEEIGYLRDSLGRPSQAGSYVSDVTYWPNGAVRSIQFANGMRSEFRQDAVLGKLKEIQHGNYWHKQYDYQSSSYVSSIVDVLDQSKSIYLDYDQLYQLKNVHSGAANGAVIAAFRYTSTGDIISQTRSGVTTNYHYSATSNRLASVQRGDQTNLVGYTPDGRINIYGQHDYGYTDDKLLASYNLPNGDQFQYLYDGNGRKIKTLRNGNLESYTLYDHRGKLIYEETPGDVTNNLIYLDERLIAKREGLYDIRYAECDYIENKQRFQTLLMHRPVYLHKHSGEPVAYGNCERYGEWVHDFKSNSGVWETVSSAKREYWVWVNQYALSDRNRSNNQGSLYRWRYKDMYVSKVKMERKYEATGTKRKYKCYRHYVIKKRIYNLKQGGYTTQTVYSGKYYTGRQKIWRMWERKPKNFSCQNPGLNHSKINWPSMSGQ